MNIYSDILTTDDLQKTIARVDGMYIDDIRPLIRPRLKTSGWEISTASKTRRRRKNNGKYGGSNINAASWDDHGRWFSLLYEIDERCRIATYEGKEDFHRRTNNRYKPTPAD